jgi:shikimate dehydrogenase
MAQEANYKAELVGAFGHPIAENPTGIMQEAAFRAVGLNWRYLLLDIQAGDLADAVRGLRTFDMRGINLTIPHKVNVLQYLDRVSEDAALMGAVNTVRREDNLLVGENTDGKGFIRSLREDAGLDSKGKCVVVLGAGGAARAITVELALAGALKITIVNRSRARGEALVELLSGKTPTDSELVLWDKTYAIPHETDILVNATSIGLFPNIHDKPDIDYDTITPQMTVCDVIPNPPHTPFLNEAKARRAHTLDGLGMLVYQGAIAFKMWSGKEAPIDVMRQALANAFGLQA